MGSPLDQGAFRSILDMVRVRHAAAQICVLHNGQVLLDRAFGCRPETPFLIFSAGKPFVAMLVHLLAERGLLALDDPVARYWPEFGQHGKDTITIRHVLQHRSGVAFARGIRRDALAATNWSRSVRALEQARPSWPPGQVPAYHVISFGFILGELIERVTGTGLREVMRTELLNPLGVANTYLGTPAPLWTHRVPVHAHGAGVGGKVRQLVFNRRAIRQAVIPAATMSSTARDLARFYQMLLVGGEVDGIRVFAPATVAQARQPSSDGEIDQVLHLPIRWSQGFQLGGPGPDPTRPRPMGRNSSPNTFGHNGSNCCIGWADPDRQLVVAYLTNRLQTGLEGSPHQNDVSDGVLATIDETSCG
jgi:CubicO group peptidase (beta-lactamase class C family)